MTFFTNVNLAIALLLDCLPDILSRIYGQFILVDMCEKYNYIFPLFGEEFLFHVILLQVWVFHGYRHQVEYIETLWEKQKVSIIGNWISFITIFPTMYQNYNFTIFWMPICFPLMFWNFVLLKILSNKEKDIALIRLKAWLVL